MLPDWIIIVGNYVGVLCRFCSGDLLGALLVSGLSVCRYEGWTSCLAESEPALSFGVTFVGVAQTNHHTGR